MCGITGFLSSRQIDLAESRAIVARMTETLAHRGPDDRGVWIDDSAGIALGHRRLAVVDLSPHGCQPMPSSCGRYVLDYNGEIYNAGALRAELEKAGRPFRGHSDTEVLVEGIAAWGVTATVRRSIGMFAYAIWDRTERRLTLVRDRLGIKPLYYARFGDAFLFGSELRALRAHPSFRGEIDRGAVELLLRHGYISSPHTIYRGVKQLPPGTSLTVSADDDALPTPVPYWNLRDVVERGAREQFAGTEDDAVAELDRLVRDAVRLRMAADVPLGAFLSGGIDSSTVVGVMQSLSDRPIRTFSIGFDEPSYNEAGYAAGVAAHLKTDHVERIVTAREARDVIPRLPELFDEPFADSSQIPTFLVSQIARQHVTVSLSGDGGDELFAGYNRYFHIPRVWARAERIPKALRCLGGLIASWCGALAGENRVGGALRARGEFAAIADARQAYAVLNTHWRRSDRALIDSPRLMAVADDPARWANVDPLMRHMMHVDAAGYLPDDILVKVDRASMAVGLEARVPLLDHRIVEFASTLPIEWNVRNGTGKHLLRRVLDRYVPRHLVDRPKVGFGIPIDGWLRGPLRDWAESLLDARRLAREGFFRPAPIRARWEAHLSGQGDWHYHLWDVLMFQAWREHWHP